MDDPYLCVKIKHCYCWFDASGPCCYCGAPVSEDDEEDE